MICDGHFCVWWSLFLETTRVLVVEPVVINWEENNFIIYQDLPRWSIFQLSCSHQHNPRSMLTKQWGVLFHLEPPAKIQTKTLPLKTLPSPSCYWQLIPTHMHKFCPDNFLQFFSFRELSPNLFARASRSSFGGNFENCGISLQWETIWKLLNNLWNVKLSQKRFSWEGH